jgi:hypothetical protein
MTRKRKQKPDKSFGRVPPAEFKKAIEAPYGVAREIIWQYEPNFQAPLDESEDEKD